MFFLARFRLFCLGLLTVVSGVVAAGEAELGDYRAVSGVSGTLSATGSDTVANLTTLWAEEFRRVYPNVNIQIQATGSSAAPTALTETTASIGLMSRTMRRNEVASFTARYGYPPTPLPVALDALAILVHRDNPLPSIALDEIDAIFSATLRCNAEGAIVKLAGSWPAGALGRTENSRLRPQLGLGHLWLFQGGGAVPGGLPPEGE